jgi:hypothetical protein
VRTSTSQQPVFGSNPVFSTESSRELHSPHYDEVHAYFLTNAFPEHEAQKFFNHYASNGWLIGGKSPMVDWKASAQKWILNSANFPVSKSMERAGQLNASNHKNYGEPL